MREYLSKADNPLASILDFQNNFGLDSLQNYLVSEQKKEQEEQKKEEQKGEGGGEGGKEGKEEGEETQWKDVVSLLDLLQMPRSQLFLGLVDLMKKTLLVCLIYLSI